MSFWSKLSFIFTGMVMSVSAHSDPGFHEVVLFDCEIRSESLRTAGAKLNVRVIEQSGANGPIKSLFFQYEDPANNDFGEVRVQAENLSSDSELILTNQATRCDLRLSWLDKGFLRLGLKSTFAIREGDKNHVVYIGEALFHTGIRVLSGGAICKMPGRLNVRVKAK